MKIADPKLYRILMFNNYFMYVTIFLTAKS